MNLDRSLLLIQSLPIRIYLGAF